MLLTIKQVDQCKTILGSALPHARYLNEPYYLGGATRAVKKGSEDGDVELCAWLSDGHPVPPGRRENTFRAGKGAARARLSGKQTLAGFENRSF